MTKSSIPIVIGGASIPIILLIGILLIFSSNKENGLLLIILGFLIGLVLAGISRRFR